MSNVAESDTPTAQPKSAYRTRWFWRRIIKRTVLLLALSSLGLFGISMSAKPPSHLGVQAGKLTECPASPNCVSTCTESDDHRLPPVSFRGSQHEALLKIKQIVTQQFPRAELVDENESYLRYEFTSLIFRFVDDVEFLVDDSKQQIHFRSASRVGHSDLGANRRRMKKISEELTR